MGEASEPVWTLWRRGGEYVRTYVCCGYIRCVDGKYVGGWVVSGYIYMVMKERPGLTQIRCNPTVLWLSQLTIRM